MSDTKKFWQVILNSYATEFPNFINIVQILTLYPCSNACVERGFSTMPRVKTDYRNRLEVETLDHLMRISIERPESICFDSKKSVDSFFSRPRRPNVASYGPRQNKRLSDPGSSKDELVTKKVCTIDLLDSDSDESS